MMLCLVYTIRIMLPWVTTKVRDQLYPAILDPVTWIYGARLTTTSLVKSATRVLSIKSVWGEVLTPSICMRKWHSK